LGYGELTDFLSKAFGQRRKKLRNNLLRTFPIRSDLLDALFQKLGLSENVRAENLSPAQYEEMIKRIKEDQKDQGSASS